MLSYRWSKRAGSIRLDDGTVPNKRRSAHPAQWINCEPAGFLLAIVIRDGLIEGKVGESNDDLAN
jgi:hypothetical protein